MSLDEAVGVVRDGDRVYVHGGVCTPRVLVEGLVAIRDDLRGVEVVHLHTDAPAPYVEPGMEGRFRHNALFIGPNVRVTIRRFFFRILRGSSNGTGRCRWTLRSSR